MTGTIFFIFPNIPEPIQTLLATNQPLPAPEVLASQVAPEHQTAKAGQWCWILQTFLYMQQAGLDVALVEEPVAGAICVAHFDTTKNKVWAPDAFVIGIRADRPPLRMCEVEIVQNPENLRGNQRFLVKHWPQPGLIPRDAARGDRVERISFFGNHVNFSPRFRDPSFRDALKEMGVELNICCDPAQWHDFRETDLILAIRNNIHSLVRKTKPPIKLINAWQGQCVALLGEEPAYRAIGRPGEDYFEIASPQDVLNIVTQFKNDPSLYQRVRQAGIERYRDFSVEAVQQQWIELLKGPIAEAFKDWQQGVGKNHSARYARRSWQATHQWVGQKWFWSQVRSGEFMQRRLSQTR
ncbi:hypothetical protein IFO70_09935 [Phormidium tenue FACHB-886]|nr:hypothetical protein [Phormidium tenue FACHB-886]